MTDIDLRPAKGTLLYELLRLGFVFDHSNGDGSRSWMKYTDNLRADAASPSVVHEVADSSAVYVLMPMRV